MLYMYGNNVTFMMIDLGDNTVLNPVTMFRLSFQDMGSRDVCHQQQQTRGRWSSESIVTYCCHPRINSMVKGTTEQTSKSGLEEQAALTAVPV